MLPTKYAAELSNLRKFKDALNGYLRNSRIQDSRIPDIELAVEELIVNIINYGYPDAIGAAELICEERDDGLMLKIIDEGIPFDPTKSPSPKLDAPLQERSKGGMGIYLAKSLLDDISYQRNGDKNILSIIVNI